ncbi:hypothetical protein AAVH_31716, partial [Aphelenchoides avenae]
LYRMSAGAWTDLTQRPSTLGNSVVKYTVTLELITLTLYLIMIVVDKFVDLTLIWEKVGPLSRILGGVEAFACAIVYRML